MVNLDQIQNEYWDLSPSVRRKGNSVVLSSIYFDIKNVIVVFSHF